MSRTPDLALASIAFNKPALVRQQIRLLHKYLRDEFTLAVFDNSSDPDAATRIMAECSKSNTLYLRISVPQYLHPYALDKAAAHLLAGDSPYIGFLDHDVFPTEPTKLIPLIKRAGFYGVGQRHSPTDSLYLWPGFMFLSRAWLASKAPRRLNFDGIRGTQKKDDGDCGSMNAALFADEDWDKLYVGEHGYRAIRQPDDVGLQSWGVERIATDWLHLTNGSGWMNVPDFPGREALCMELLDAL